MPTTASIQTCLRQSSLGTGLDDPQLAALASFATLTQHPAGRVLFTEGSVADAVSVVCRGSVALDMHVPLRGSVRILTLGAGDMLGWSAIAGDGIMTTTATVLEDAVLLKLMTTALRTACSEDQTLGYAVMNLVARSLAMRLRGTRLQMLDLFSETQPAPSSATGRSPS